MSAGIVVVPSKLGETVLASQYSARWSQQPQLVTQK